MQKFKTIATLVIASMMLGSGLTLYYQDASQPYVYAKEPTPEPTPKEVRVKIDYTGVSQEKIESMILAELPPIFIEIARCESELKQYEEDGTVLQGRVDGHDTGVFQINKRYHLETAKSMGLDIHELPDNIKFAKHLYEQSGLAPWSASKPCWGG